MSNGADHQFDGEPEVAWVVKARESVADCTDVGVALWREALVLDVPGAEVRCPGVRVKSSELGVERAVAEDEVGTPGGDPVGKRENWTMSASAVATR